VESLKNTNTSSDKLADDLSALKVKDEKNEVTNEGTEDKDSKQETDSKDSKSDSNETSKDWYRKEDLKLYR